MSVRDISESVAIFAVVGPKSGDLCKDVIGDAVLAAAGQMSTFGLGGSEVCLCSPRTRRVLSYFSGSQHILISGSHHILIWQGGMKYIVAVSLSSALQQNVWVIRLGSAFEQYVFTSGKYV